MPSIMFQSRITFQVMFLILFLYKFSSFFTQVCVPLHFVKEFEYPSVILLLYLFFVDKNKPIFENNINNYLNEYYSEL